MQSKIARRILLYCLLVVISFCIGFPFVFMASLSLQSPQEVSKFPPTLIPKPIQWYNYIEIFKLFPVSRYLLNSFLFALGITFGHLCLSSMTGYALAKLRIPLTHVFSIFFLSNMFFPETLRIIPMYVMVTRLGWFNTYQGLIVPFLTGGFTIFLMRQYTLSVPNELMDAARIDGASEIKIFLRIILPIAKPALGTIAIFQFIYRWNCLMWPLIVTRADHSTLSVAVSQLRTTELFTPWNLVATTSILLFLPALFVFLFTQRSLIQMLGGGLKY